MVRELFVRDGNYVNKPTNENVAPSMLDSIDVPLKKLNNNSQTKSDSLKIKREAIKKAREFEKEGWKLVTIRGIYSYGNENPYRYDIESWGGFKE